MKTNLIIDGNYLLQKSVFILFKYKTLYTDLELILERDFNTLKNLYYFDNIYFISDSRKNWRKSFYKEYKSTRKKNENIDWNSVYEIYDEFKEKIKTIPNCKFYQVDYLEGDDIISYITKKSNKLGFSNLIIASDSDLYQLVNYDITKKYINFAYNFKFTDEKLYLPLQYNTFIDSISNSDGINDLFNNDNNNLEFIEFINGLISNKQVMEIDSERELFIKVIGHNKDNIKSIYYKNKRGIGKVGCGKLYNFYKETYGNNMIDFDSVEFRNNILESVKLYKKVKDDEMDNDILNRLSMNLKIVKFDKISTPPHLYKEMETTVIL